jgi:hypothetical protein
VIYLLLHYSGNLYRSHHTILLPLGLVKTKICLDEAERKENGVMRPVEVSRVV